MSQVAIRRNDSTVVETPDQAVPALKPRMLVVDDETSMRDMLRIVLKRDGYDVVIAENGISHPQAGLTLLPQRRLAHPQVRVTAFPDQSDSFRQPKLQISRRLPVTLVPPMSSGLTRRLRHLLYHRPV